MAYAMLTTYGKTSHSLSAASCLLRGYASLYPLDAAERRHLVTLVACRLACSATLGAYSYSQDPSNEYLLLHAEPCWKVLEMLWSMPRHAVEGMISLALSPPQGGEEETEDLCVPDPSVFDVLSSVRAKRPSPGSEPAGEDAGGTITFVTGNANKLQEVQVRSPCEEGP